MFSVFYFLYSIFCILFSVFYILMHLVLCLLLVSVSALVPETLSTLFSTPDHSFGQKGDGYLDSDDSTYIVKSSRLSVNGNMDRIQEKENMNCTGLDCKCVCV